MAFLQKIIQNGYTKLLISDSGLITGKCSKFLLKGQKRFWKTLLLLLPPLMTTLKATLCSSTVISH